jgi:hypothetical protein
MEKMCINSTFTISMYKIFTKSVKYLLISTFGRFYNMLINRLIQKWYVYCV